MPAAVGAATLDTLSERFAQSAPMGRIASADDVAGFHRLAVLEGADYVTGELLMLDGGMRLSGGVQRKKP